MQKPKPPSSPRLLIRRVIEASEQRDHFSTARLRLVRELRLVLGGDQAQVADLIHGALHGWTSAQVEIECLLESLYVDAGR
jgi:hypothetical protein